jgi:hypothetical protein
MMSFIVRKCKMLMSFITESSELQSVTNEMLTSTWSETEYHLDVCCATNGAAY